METDQPDLHIFTRLTNDCPRNDENEATVANKMEDTPPRPAARRGAPSQLAKIIPATLGICTHSLACGPKPFMSHLPWTQTDRREEPTGGQPAALEHLQQAPKNFAPKKSFTAPK